MVDGKKQELIANRSWRIARILIDHKPYANAHFFGRETNDASRSRYDVP